MRWENKRKNVKVLYYCKQMWTAEAAAKKSYNCVAILKFNDTSTFPRQYERCDGKFSCWSPSMEIYSRIDRCQERHFPESNASKLQIKKEKKRLSSWILIICLIQSSCAKEIHFVNPIANVDLFIWKMEKQNVSLFIPEIISKRELVVIFVENNLASG